MASMRKLKRRLLHWERYERCVNRRQPWEYWFLLPGHYRAITAAATEHERRRARTVYWPTGTRGLP